MSKFSDVSLSEISINDGTERLGLYFGTLAGTALTTGSADGIGSAARFNFPQGIAVGPAGSLYVADGNFTIRKVTKAGAVTTIAGRTLVQGTADGTGSAARFSDPIGVAVDRARNVFVADRNANTIRKVTDAGVVTTLAGNPIATPSGASADGTGSAARFSSPRGITIDTAGNLFVADTGNHTIRKVTSAGVVLTVAGLAGSNFESTNGIGSAARFNNPYGVAVDTAGNVFVTGSDMTVRNSNGILTAY